MPVRANRRLEQLGCQLCCVAPTGEHPPHTSHFPLPAGFPAAAGARAPRPPLLTAAHREQWAEDGYLVVRGCVDPATVGAVAADMWGFLDMDPADPATWYRYKEGMLRVHGVEGSGENTMLNMWQTQGMWNARQHPAVHQAFSELWGTEELRVSIDTADMKPPAKPELPGWGGPLRCARTQCVCNLVVIMTVCTLIAAGMYRLHIDLSPDFMAAGSDTFAMGPGSAAAAAGQPRWNTARCAQGEIFCGPMAAEGGGLRILPGFHRRWAEWVEAHPGVDISEWLSPEKAGAQTDVQNAVAFGLRSELPGVLLPAEANLASGKWGQLVDVEGGPGDLVIWNSWLPHGNGVNRSAEPRLVQVNTHNSL